MIELTVGAQQLLDNYFAELREVLVDDGKADPVDVERDIRDHIQTALADTDGPVDESRLDQVLRSLGAPAEWIDHPDRLWFARPSKAGPNSEKLPVAESVPQSIGGRESSRLPYLSLLTLALGLMLSFLAGDLKAGVAIFAVAVTGAFVLVRAAVAIQPEMVLSTAQRWLLSPALLMVYLPLLIVLVAWPVAWGTTIVNESHWGPRIKLHEAQAVRESVKAMKAKGIRVIYSRGGKPIVQDYENQLNRLDEKIRELQGAQRDWRRVLTVPAIITLGWWMILAAVSITMPGTLRTVFAPFSARFVRRSMLGICVISVATGVIVGVFWPWVSP